MKRITLAINGVVRQFEAEWAPLDDLFEFTIAETPFLPSHAKALFREAEKAQPPMIEITAPPARRRGDFPEGRGICIRFVRP